MRKILLLLVIGICLNATSLVDAYRTGGTEALELKVEEIIQNPAYWRDYLKNKDTDAGFYESDSSLVIVDKKAQNMKLLYNSNFKQNEKFFQNIITGQMGDKYKEGDLKTPVGVYDVVRKFIPKDTFYGPVSFELSYPNILDKLSGKGGHGIWIHGYPLDNSSRPPQTKGCVALKNDLLLKFDAKLKSKHAIVIVYEDGYKKASKDDIARILANIYQWRYAWKISDVDAYLDFYSPNFVRFDGKNKKQFSSMKRQIFRRSEDKIIRFTNISISPYPNVKNKNVYRIVFDEYYKTKKYSFSGKKQLYAELKNGKMQILVEK